MSRVVLAPLLLVLLATCAFGQLCSSGNPDIKDTDRQFMVDKHNEYRSLTANGKAVNSDGSNLPSGKNIFKVKWDCTLEAEAQAVADSNAQNGCQMEHKDPNPFGENLAEGYGASDSSKYTSEVFPTSVKMWYDELPKIGYYGNIGSFVFDTSIGHWSQVIWGKSKRIGCGVAKCDSNYDFDTGNGILTKSIIACQYWPGGNSKAALYDVGSPCQQNSDCPTDATCSTADGLCVDASANAKTPLPSAAEVLAFKQVMPKVNLNDPGVTKIVSGYSQSGLGVVTYSIWNGCKQDSDCRVPANGLGGTCRTSDRKCVDPNWAKSGCWAC